MGDSDSAEPSASGATVMEVGQAAINTHPAEEKHRMEGTELNEQTEQRKQTESETACTMIVEQQEQQKSGEELKGCELSLEQAEEYRDNTLSSSCAQQQSGAKDSSLKQLQPVTPSSHDCVKRVTAASSSGTGLQNGDLVHNSSAVLHEKEEEEETNLKETAQLKEKIREGEKDHTKEEQEEQQQTVVTVTADRGGDRYHCGGCDVWGQGHSFEEHVLRHILPEPYQCLYCPLSFSSRYHALSHVHQQHPLLKKSCALIDLKKAKAIMTQAKQAGKHAFQACISGRVHHVKSLTKITDKSKASKADSVLGAEEFGKDVRQTYAVCCGDTDSSAKLATSELLNDITLENDCTVENLVSDSQDMADEELSCMGEEGDGSNQLVTGDCTQDGVEADQAASIEQIRGSHSNSSKHSSSTNKQDIIADDDCIENDTNTVCESKMNSMNGSDNYTDATLKPETTTAGLNSSHSEMEVSKADTCVYGIPDIPSCETKPANVDSEIMEKEVVGISVDPGEYKSDESKGVNISPVYAGEQSDIMDSSSSRSIEFPASNFEHVEEDMDSSSSRSIEFPASNFEHVEEDIVGSSSSKSIESPASNFEHVEEDSDMLGLKIVDTFCLQEDGELQVSTGSEENTSECQNKSECQENRSEEMEHLHPSLQQADSEAMDVHSTEAMEVHSTEAMDVHSAEAMDVHSTEAVHTHSAEAMVVHSAEAVHTHSAEAMDVYSAEAVRIHSAEIVDIQSAEAMNTCSAETVNTHSTEAMDTCSADSSDSAVAEPASPDDSDTRATVRLLGPPSKPTVSFSFLGDPAQNESVFSPRGEVYAHQSSFHFFICSFNCSFSCLMSGEFRDHLVVDHAGETVFTCFHCGFQAGGEDGLIRHISAHAHTYSKSVPLYSCGASACKFGSNLVSDFVSHQSSWHPDLTVFHCHDCDKRFPNVEQLLEHFEDNLLHVINCLLCSAKSMERRTLLQHMAAAHPGRPKMISVAKQIICRDRKLNDYWSFIQQHCDSAMGAVDPFSAEMTEVQDKSKCVDQAGPGSVRNKCLLSILTGSLKSEEAQLIKSVTYDRKEITSEESGILGDTLSDSCGEEDCSEESWSETGSPNAKTDDILNFKCNLCTFVARDPSRLKGHEQGHSCPSSRKTRFKCKFCPQSFNNDDKFISHISCHPGPIHFDLYCCRQCNYDSNQKHILLKHIRVTHKKSCTFEDELYSVVSKDIESRVLECGQCSYMTRHRKHLVDHMKREHRGVRPVAGSSQTLSHVSSPRTPGHCATESSNSSSAQLKDWSQDLSARTEGVVKEYQTRRFKCPICQYLLVRASDLQSHVKRHSEVGEITLVMFRCKYCSASSTAREIVWSHLQEKHAGRQLALVKKIVKIDTRADDNGYAVTSVEDSNNAEVDVFPSKIENQMVLVIPDSTEDTFQVAMHCPRCDYTSLSRHCIIMHVYSQHHDVQVMGRRQDNELYPLEIQNSLSKTLAGEHVVLGEALKGDILIVPDSTEFDEVAQCPRCDFATLNRKSIVQHLQENHPDVSAMGRNDYAAFDGEEHNKRTDGMVIIGSGSLDDKLRCLYKNEVSGGVKCLICKACRPKRFFMHLHLLRHLNLRLWACRYCPHKGLQKYKLVDHIRKVHHNRPPCVRYIPANVEQAVSQYLHSASHIQDRRGGNVGTGSQSPTQDEEGGAKTGGGDSLVGCLLGEEELDIQLACLYSLQENGLLRCVACGHEFQRKFAMHRHLVQSHLQVNLIGCGYCSMEGVERNAVKDHILQAHPSATLRMRGLAYQLQDRVTDLLTRMTLPAEAADLDLSSSESGDDKYPEPPTLTPQGSEREETTLDATLGFEGEGTPLGLTLAKNVSHGGRSQVLQLGKECLDRQLQPMFRRMPGPVLKFRCQVCRGIFDRRYAIHRHVLMKHLKAGILGCPSCPFQAVEKYQVLGHIKEKHPGAELRATHLLISLHSLVAEYMRSVENGTIDPNSKAPPPWSMKKVVKNESEAVEDSDTLPSTSSGLGQSLVVAMFGKGRLPFRIKSEPEEVENEGDIGVKAPKLHISEEEEEGGNVAENRNAAGVDNSEAGVSPQQSLNMTRIKSAVDVQTNIRVISVRKNGVRQHICEKCNFTSAHRSNVVRHIYRVHEQYREQECPFCNYRTLSQVLIESHLKNEHPGLTLPEGLLLKGVKRKAETGGSVPAKKLHLSESMDESSLDNSCNQTYECAQCNFEAQTQSDMEQHMRSAHCVKKQGQNNMESTQPEDDDSDDDDTEFVSLAHSVKMSQLNASDDWQDCLWQCCCCSYKSSSEEDLKMHFLDLHPNEPYRSKRLAVWRFVCSSCNVKTRAHSKMRYHLNRHIKYRPYTCTTCGAFYPSPDQCRKHCRANGHEETFTYVRIEGKETRLRQLLRECQENASTLAASFGDTEVTPDHSFSTPQPSKRMAKKSFPSSAVAGKLLKMDYDDPESPGGNSDGKAVDEGELMGCSHCDFTAQTVYGVKTHHIGTHPDQEFLWKDCTTGHVCKGSGEITNSKEVPGSLEAPPDSGYWTTGSGLLSCRHCPFTTTTVQAIKSHIKRHQPKRFLCPYCSMRCSRLDTVSMHVRCAHKGRELWTIHFQLPVDFTPDLDKSEDTPMELAEPQITFQSQTEQEDEGKEEEEDKEEGNVKETRRTPKKPRRQSRGSSDLHSVQERVGCKHCDVKMECVSAVFDHHSTSHPHLPFLWVDSASGYTFNSAGEVKDTNASAPDLFSDEGFEVETDRRNTPSFRCKLCAFTSSYIQAIKSHMKSHLPHGFMCPYCCMTTSSKEKMVSHQTCIHQDQPSWVLHLRMTTAPSGPSQECS